MLSPVNPVHVQAAADLYEEQRLDGWRRELSRFDEKLLQELIHAGTPQSRAAYSTSASCFSGLTT